MEDAKITLSKNITELRLLNNMTQVELAQKLNYSDKTISKWERGESTPDINVLVEMSDLFGVTLDYLIRGTNAQTEETITLKKDTQTKYNHRVITYLSQGLVWFIALFAFINCLGSLGLNNGGLNIKNLGNSSCGDFCSRDNNKHSCRHCSRKDNHNHIDNECLKITDCID